MLCCVNKCILHKYAKCITKTDNSSGYAVVNSKHIILYSRLHCMHGDVRESESVAVKNSALGALGVCV